MGLTLETRFTAKLSTLGRQRWSYEWSGWRRAAQKPGPDLASDANSGFGEKCLSGNGVPHTKVSDSSVYLTGVSAHCIVKCCGLKFLALFFVDFQAYLFVDMFYLLAKHRHCFAGIVILGSCICVVLGFSAEVVSSIYQTICHCHPMGCAG